MATILDQLHTDHINVVKLLELFERELEVLKRSDSEPNYFKWQNILLYMTTYQDVFHHPAEEKVFAYLCIDDPEVSQAVKEVESQHEILYQKSERLQGLLMDVETNTITIDKSDLHIACKDYIHQLQKHMSLEEAIIFPYAKKQLQKSDLNDLDKSIKKINDPLFGLIKRAEFSELYQCICEQ